MEYIDFRILRRLFQVSLEMGRNINYVNPTEDYENIFPNREKTSSLYLYGPADIEEMRSVEASLKEYPQKIRAYLNGCPSSSWSIILTDYVQEITRCYNYLKINYEIYNDGMTKKYEWVVNSIIEYNLMLSNKDDVIVKPVDGYNVISFNKEDVVLNPNPKNFNIAVQICELAYNIVYDVVKVYCPKDLKLFSMFPFVDADKKTSNRYLEEAQENKYFQQIRETAVNEGWIDNEGFWTKEERGTSIERVGGLSYFIKCALFKSGITDEIDFKLELTPFSSMFKGLEGQSPKNISDKLNHFKKDNPYFEMKRRIEILCNSAIVNNPLGHAKILLNQNNLS